MEGHRDFVKGLCWDPAGNFLASQSDDRTVIIWNVYDWTPVKTISEPFMKPFGQSFFKRLSWSPEGSQLCAVQACDESQHLITASVIERQSWEQKASLIGHGMIIECSVGVHIVKSTSYCQSYSPIVFRGKSVKEPYFLCALGSQDGSISLWNSSRSRALLVIKDVFKNAIFDIKWSPDGQLLCACSLDGSIAILCAGDFIPGKSYTQNDHKWRTISCKTFDSAFGKNLISDQLEDLLSRFGYRKNLSRKRRENIPEFPELVHLKEPKLYKLDSNLSQTSDKTDFLDQRLKSGDMGSFAQKKPQTDYQVQKKAISTNGQAPTKRRIQPVSISSPSRSENLHYFNQPKYLSLENKIEEQIRNNPLPVISDLPTSLTIPSLKQRVMVDLEKSGDKIQIIAEQPALKGITRVQFLSRRHYSSWIDYVPSPVLQFSTSNEIILASLLDGTIISWSYGGRRKFPAINIGCTVSRMKITDKYWAVISKKGALFVWNSEGKSILSGVSVAPILIKNITEVEKHRQKDKITQSEAFKIKKITSFDIDYSGMVVLGLNDYSFYTFDCNSNAWIKLKSQSEFNRLSDMYLPDNIETFTQRSKSLLKFHTKNVMRDLQSRTQRTSDAKQIMALSQIEEMMNLSIILKDDESYQSLLLEYATKLSDLGDLSMSRASELCKFLSSNSNEVLLGHRKVDLFKMVYPILARNSNLHRLIVGYREDLTEEIPKNFASIF